MKHRFSQFGSISWGVLSVVGGVAALVSCTSVNNKSVGPNAALTSSEPIVEGFVEYPGPRSAWGGPQAVLYHVSAKDSERPRLWVSPDTFAPAGLKPASEPQPVEGRTPASQLSSAPHEPAKAEASAPAGYELAMPVEAVREELSGIVDEFAENDSDVKGCMYPVRLRLVRANGAVIERQGCRGIGTWTRATSEAVSRFQNAAVEFKRAPASEHGSEHEAHH